MWLQGLSTVVVLTFLSVFSPGKSTVQFTVSNFGVNTVEGSFADVKGTVNFDQAHPAKAEIDVHVAVNTISTGIAERDEHLQESEYFHAEKYPFIKFKSTSVSKTKSGVLLKGTLTIKGISKAIVVPATYTQKGLTCNFTIDRYDFKVGSSGSFAIGRDVAVAVYLAF